MPGSTLSDATPRLPRPTRDEAEVVAALVPGVARALDWPRVAGLAAPWIHAVREHPPSFWALASLLQEYPIGSDEGLALMRLAEALLRVPDAETAIALTADQLGRARFDEAAARGEGAHKLLSGLAAEALALSRRLLPAEQQAHEGLLQRLGARTVVAATVRAIQLLGRQFVLGRSIGEALDEADTARRRAERVPLRFSYDMLGEAARTEADAQRYLAAYAQAIAAVAARTPPGTGPEAADGLSIKLSALFSRYEESQRDRVFAILLPRVRSLVDVAARAGLNLTLDAEESERLELSLDLFEALAEASAAAHPGWRGLGLAVQAYQTRAADAIDEVLRMARRHRVRLMVRLVKGAYWDSEIKRAQELGLDGYPVFTRKAHTDLSYLACAQALLAQAAGPDAPVYPQFATHNAATLAALLQGAEGQGARFELQRLHGMGEGVYREVYKHLASTGDDAAGAVPALRVYAPVGEHRDLLAYLVRRLLENGANSSFVHQLADPTVGLETLLASPLDAPGTPALPLPTALYGSGPGARVNSRGLDLASAEDRAPLRQALASVQVGTMAQATPDDVAAALAALQRAFPAWASTPLEQRTATLRRAADLLEQRLPAFAALVVQEGRKTWPDAVSEVREAVDYGRYYAQQAAWRLAPQDLPGPTGEHNRLTLHGRGIFACISPWNFPLAIFGGQVMAALVAGNAVAAKPAEQTPAVAARLVALLHEAGVPREALALLHGPGETVGAALVADERVAGVCFTGSTEVARGIHRALAARNGPIVPLIAETGGLNAMLVDSTALPEQVVDAVVQSAFRSTGQRCSALRLLLLHEGVAGPVLEMLAGAMQMLRVGDPARFSTDAGPVIDDAAQASLQRHIERLSREARLIARTPPGPDDPPIPRLVAPVAFELARLEELREEIFGPVLHVVRWTGDPLQVIERVNALGYGLTLGLHTRIDGRAQRLAQAARVGNVYVNRNIVGAVVGVQPFGGEGLSGTGPKAGGPHYLYRFCTERTLTVNTAAVGGNVELLAGRGL